MKKRLMMTITIMASLASVGATVVTARRVDGARDNLQDVRTLSAQGHPSSSIPAVIQSPHYSDKNIATRTPIKHLFVIVDENHSFDNVFGTYPNAPGFHPLPGTPKVDGLPKNAYNLAENGQPVKPWQINSPKTSDLPHGVRQMIDDWHQGHMDGFVKTFQRYMPKTDNYKLPMGYYSYNIVGPYWNLAQHFALSDHWFQPIFGPTLPNMMVLVSGQSGTPARPIKTTVPPGPYRYTYPNVGDQLNKKHIHWIWLQGELRDPYHVVKDCPFLEFKNEQLGKYKGEIGSLSHLSKDLSRTGLPSVVFVKPDGKSDHPGTNIVPGIHYSIQLVNEIMKSRYWKNSMIVLTFDESGGFYDHVTPPNVPGMKKLDGIPGFGSRVPTLVISPYAKHNFVSHKTMSSLSILHFIDWNWNLKYLNHEVAVANNLTAFLNLPQAKRTSSLKDPDTV